MNKIFTINRLVKVFFVIVLICISLTSYTSMTGLGGGYTGAPGELTCVSCHTGTPVASGSAYDAIALTGIPAGGYVPGTSYTLTLNGSTAATSRNGFQIIALTSANAMAGSFTAGAGSLTIAGSGGKTYVGHSSSGMAQSSWSFTWTAPSTASGTITFYLAFNATNGNSSSSLDVVYIKTFSFSPGNLPTAVISSPANNAIVCLGDSVQFTGTGANNPTSYNWQFLGNTPSSSNLQNPKLLYATAGYKTIRLITSNSSGTSNVSQITIQVLAKPTASISPSSGAYICGNDSAILTGPSGTGYTYQWTPGNFSGQILKTSTPGSYSVKVTNAGNCFSVSSAVPVISGIKPALSVSLSTDSVCTGDSVTIIGTQGLVNYKYIYNSVLLDSTSQFSKRVLFPVSGFIKVIGNNGQCNSDTFNHQIMFQSRPPAPVVACGQGTSSSVVFTISGQGPELSLDSGKTWILPNQGNNHFVSGLSPNQMIRIQARNAALAPCGYSYSTSKTCVAASCPPLTYMIESPAYVCSGGSGNKTKVWIRIKNSSTNTPLIKCLPFVPDYTRLDSFEVELTTPGVNSFLVSVLDSVRLNCPAKDTTIAIRYTDPANPAPLLVTGKQVLCENGEVQFTVSQLLSSVNRVEYYKNLTATPFAVRNRAEGFNLVINPVFPTIRHGDQIKISARDSISGCITYSSPIVTGVKAPSPSGFTIQKSNLNIELTDTTGLTSKRTWIFGDNDSVVNANRVQLHTYKSVGNYIIEMKANDEAGCFTSFSLAVLINATGQLEEVNANGNIVFYPNPFSDKTEVRIPAAVTDPVYIFLYDVHGRLLGEFSPETFNMYAYELMTPGTYLVRYVTGEKSGWSRLVREL